MEGFDVNRFIAERKPSWERLDVLLQQVEERGLDSLGRIGARELGRLYRAISSDLLRARTELVDAAITDYLNDVVARAYAVVHAAPHGTERRILALFLGDFPRAFRREWRVIALAALLLFGGAAVGATFVAIDPHALGALIPEGHRAFTPEERVAREEQADEGANGDEAMAFSGWLFTHNIQVSFLVFALGLTFGAGTIALLFYNGVPLGALAMHYHASGQSLFFWAWILPHGVPELTEVCVAGGAGLIIARALWLPGRRSRRDALVQEARLAASLVLGGMPILVLAGLIEGTISQMHEPVVPYEAKLLFAALVALALYAYLLHAGRDASAHDVDQNKSSSVD